MWNEHCSYKSSRLHLKGLPTKAPWVIQGPGENAGVIDIGDGQAVVFKMESHNHPSYIEPYQGATTGVGGILRDVFTMGARPIACCLNALSFGAPEHARTRIPVSGVVAGVGGYGTLFGVPTAGGQVRFHTRYDGNILVNAMAVGLADTDKIFYVAASGVNADRSAIPKRPRRHPRRLDGLGRVRRQVRRRSVPLVQVGDPFAEKLLLSSPRSWKPIASSRSRTWARRARPARRSRWALAATSASTSVSMRCRPGEIGMSAYEMMLESQERMLMVLKPGEGKGSRGDLQETGPISPWLHHAEQALRAVKHGGDVMADLPIKELATRRCL